MMARVCDSCGTTVGEDERYIDLLVMVKAITASLAHETGRH